MGDHPQPQPSPTTLDTFVRLLRWRRLILINTLIVAAAAVVISLLLPNWYEAEVSLLPPKDELGMLGGALGGLAGTMGGGGSALAALSASYNLPLWSSPSDLLVGVLRSRRLREAVAREHGLAEVYEVENIDQVLLAMRERIKTGARINGIVWLSVLDKEPERAAAIAQSCLDHLDTIQRETNRSRAAAVRGFIEQRLAATERGLAATEDSLQAFQERHGLLAPEEQTRALVETIAGVEAQRLAAVVERDALLAQVGPDHPEVKRYHALVASLQEARASLEGDWSRATTGGPSAIIGLSQLPSLTFEFLRRYREAEIQAAVFELLTQLHEQYRIQEVRDLPTIQVLDPPVPPQEKARPHRAVICVIATLLAFVASLFVAWQLDRAAQLAERDPGQYAQLEKLLSGVGLRFVLPRR